ncbi:hypothetical protein [Reichenbachiella sp.]|uniref:hypothetical protein n=1 Tax=Reichenbachiella sp. TaxID=2184521 RepID=UPI0032977E37
MELIDTGEIYNGLIVAAIEIFLIVGGLELLSKKREKKQLLDLRKNTRSILKRKVIRVREALESIILAINNEQIDDDLKNVHQYIERIDKSPFLELEKLNENINSYLFLRYSLMDKPTTAFMLELVDRTEKTLNTWCIERIMERKTQEERVFVRVKDFVRGIERLPTDLKEQIKYMNNATLDLTYSKYSKDEGRDELSKLSGRLQ